MLFRSGIKERRVADESESTSDLGVKASLLAIERAGIELSQIDAVICATLSPEYLTMPSTACLIANKLGIKNVMAFDVSAACSGFVYLLNIAKSFIESGAYKNILIVGAEKITKHIDFCDRGTCILFGDGGGAGIVSATEDKNEAILDVHVGSDGAYGELLMTPFTDKNRQYLHMAGNEVFKIAVKTLAQDAQEILEKNSINIDDIDLFIPHQANLRIIEAVRQKLNFPAQRVVLTVHKYGNTSAASIPMAMNEAYESGRLKKGDLMLLDTFGGGFTWGSALVRVGGN